MGLHLLDVDLGVDHHGALVDHAQLAFLVVVFVIDLADDLLDHILQGHQAAHPAELVDNDGQVDLLQLELAQQLGDRLGFGDEGDRVEELAQVEVGLRAAGADAQQVLGMEDADDVIRVAFVDGDAGVAFLVDQPDQVRHRGVRGGADHLRRRGHDLRGLGAAEIKDRVDQPFLVDGDQPLFFALLEQFLDLVLQFFRGVGRAAEAEGGFEFVKQRFTRGFFVRGRRTRRRRLHSFHKKCVSPSVG